MGKKLLFAYHFLQITFVQTCPFGGKKTSQNVMEKKDNKVNNKTVYKEKGKGEKEESKKKKSK